MMKPIQFFQSLTQQIMAASTEPDLASDAAIDIWSYAEPAGEEPIPQIRNVLQWRRLISSVRDPLESFPGQKVNVIGFVFRPAKLDADQFVIARSVIRCCLADTVPLGLLVNTPQADYYADEQWLRVQGQFGIQSVQGRPMLVIHPTRLQPIRIPQKQYINGVF
jgi:uncharacterized repeat protein (TIGR03943 family)